MKKGRSMLRMNLFMLRLRECQDSVSTLMQLAGPNVERKLVSSPIPPCKHTKMGYCVDIKRNHQTRVPTIQAEE